VLTIICDDFNTVVLPNADATAKKVSKRTRGNKHILRVSCAKIDPNGTLELLVHFVERKVSVKQTTENNKNSR
jgi:hypothetical protein